ncbi:MAG: hypothetical protein JWP44_1488 [Mucilaginibacter sp.]|nr:hypothetical protein [Mucilaginibacter sp.]
MSKFDSEKLQKLKRIDNLLKSLCFFPLNKKNRPLIIDEPIAEIVIIAIMMIGDTIMSIPSLAVLKRNFPHARITLICEPVVKVILDDQNLADNFIVVNSPWLHNNYSVKNIRQLINGIKKANKTRYDIAIDFRGDWRNIFLMNFIRAKRKVSFDYSGGEYMLTDVISEKPAILHYIDQWLYLLKSIGCTVYDDDKYPSLKLTVQAEQFLNDFKTRHSLQNTFVLGVHPGASLTTRKWDEKKYIELLLKLSKKNQNLKILLFEGPNESLTILKIKNALMSERVDTIVVNESLKNYITLINCCNLLICNDSGAGHIAGAFGIPSVIIFGKSDPETVKPYNRNYIRIISHFNDNIKKMQDAGNREYLESITVNEVYKAASNFIDTVNNPHYIK